VLLRTRQPIRLPDDLYDTIEAMAEQQRATVHDVVEHATRLWVAISSETSPSDQNQARLSVGHTIEMTADQERLVLHFVRFLSRGRPKLVSALTQILEDWSEAQRAAQNRRKRPPKKAE
jgi:hypothetical protein